MTTALDEKITSGVPGFDHEVRHAVCARCNPEARPGGTYVALCGLSQTIHLDAIKRPADQLHPDACVLCRDMAIAHRDLHRKGLA